MIFYFSATGNSKYVARKIAEAQNDNVVSISKELLKVDNDFVYLDESSDLLGFVFPIYAWGVPRPVLHFLKKATFRTASSDPYVFAAATCGGDAGNGFDMLINALAQKSLSLDSAYTVAMPDNFVFMLEVEPEEKQAKKFAEADRLLIEIAETIKERKRGVFQIKRGALPGLKTGVAYPLMDRFAANTKMFYTTDACTSCGLCARYCTAGIITVPKGGKPVWGKKCNYCSACLNRCPVRAIQYGKGTLKRGRYVHPECGTSD